MEQIERMSLWLSIGLVSLAVLLAGVIGWVIGNSGSDEQEAGSTAGSVTATVPQAHQGDNLPVSAIGDPSSGEQLFTSKGCSSCHSYAGSGGEDAPPLDFMAGHLSATEIADMSGVIWNHVPAMLPHFKEEGLEFPTFKDDEMADLLAYLHGGKPGGAAKGEAATAGAGEAAGEELFASSCGSCHTLSAAATTGTTGPNLDDLMPTEEQVMSAIEGGPGAMPAGLYSGAKARAVSQYVAQNAGK